MISVKKKQKIELTKEQGWYSVSELDELGWSKQGTQFTIWTNYHDVCSLSFPSSKVWNPNLQILLGPRSMAPKPNAKLWERPTSGKDCGVCLWFPTCLSYIYIHWMYVRVYIAWALLLVCPWKAQWIWRRRRVLGDDQGNRKKDRVYNLCWSAPEAVWGHHTSGYKSHSFHDQPSLYVLRGCLNDMKI